MQQTKQTEVFNKFQDALDILAKYIDDKRGFPLEMDEDQFIFKAGNYTMAAQDIFDLLSLGWLRSEHSPQVWYYDI